MGIPSFCLFTGARSHHVTSLTTETSLLRGSLTCKDKEREKTLHLPVPAEPGHDSEALDRVKRFSYDYRP